MAKTKIQRQVRYEFRSEADPVAHHMNFLIVNDQRAARQISQRLQEILAPVDEVQIRTSGAVKGTGVRYFLLSFTSYAQNPLNVPLQRAYKGRIKRDSSLAERQAPQGLVDYVNSHFSNPTNLS
jgi:hypothetical protein